MVKKEDGRGGKRGKEKRETRYPQAANDARLCRAPGQASASPPLGPPQAAGTPEPRGGDTALPWPLLPSGGRSAGGTRQRPGPGDSPSTPSPPNPHGPAAARGPGRREAGREAGRAPSAGRRGAGKRGPERGRERGRQRGPERDPERGRERLPPARRACAPPGVSGEGMEGGREGDSH